MLILHIYTLGGLTTSLKPASKSLFELDASKTNVVSEQFFTPRRLIAVTVHSKVTWLAILDLLFRSLPWRQGRFLENGTDEACRRHKTSTPTGHWHWPVAEVAGLDRTDVVPQLTFVHT